MGVFRNLICPQIGAATRDTTGLDTPRLWIQDFFRSSRTVSGETVTASTALTLSAYYGAIRSISEDVAKLPLVTFRRLPELGPTAKERALDHPLSPILRFKPNRDMTSLAWREVMTSWALGWGGGVSEIQKNGRGQPIALWPIHPNRIKIGKDEDGVFYDVRMDKTIMVRENGRDVPKDVVRIRAENILHIHGLGPDGIRGFSIVQLAAETLGLTLAVQKFGSAFFGNGTIASGVLEHPEVLDDDALDRLRLQWAEQYAGSDNAHKPIILEEGMKWTQLTIPPNEAQFLETRKFQVNEIARWFRIPPHKIQDLERSTFSNIETQNLDYKIDTLDPWLIRWEQEIQRKLFTEAEQEEFFAEHIFDALLRGDSKARGNFYRVQFNTGSITPNEIRAMENRNPSSDPAADELYVPLNMVPLSSIGGSGHLDDEDKEDEPKDDDREENDDDDAAAPTEDDIQRERRDRLQGYVQSLNSLFVNTASRIVRKEAMATERARKKCGDDTEALEKWAEGFYAEQIEYIFTAFGAHAATVRDTARGILSTTAVDQNVWKSIAKPEVERYWNLSGAVKEHDCAMNLKKIIMHAILAPYLEHADATA